MRNRFGQVLQRHIEHHSSLYLFVLILFLMGVIFGTFAVNRIGYTQQEFLFFYFQSFIEDIKAEQLVTGAEAILQAFMKHAIYMGLIWLLGPTLIGLPGVILLLFLKGTFIGFTVGFLVQQLGLNGFFLALLTVTPQNLIIVPLYLFVSVMSISFSLKLLGLVTKVTRHFQPFQLGRYIALFGWVSLLILGTSVYEAYVSPLFMKMFG